MSGGLQYRKSASFGGARAKAAVDWEAFDEALARVDPCFSDPRFDSLKHVLTVLSSNNAEQEVEEVRAGRGGGTPAHPALPLGALRQAAAGGALGCRDTALDRLLRLPPAASRQPS